MIAAKPLAPTAPTSRLTAPFIHAIKHVMRSAVKVETTVERPHLKRLPTPKSDVSCLVGFAGRLTGTMTLAVDHVTALRIVSAFCDSTVAYESPDFADCLAELSERIASAARVEFGDDVHMASPTVILGDQHTSARLTQAPCLVLPCKTPIGPFHLELCMKSQS
jgi:chemotaxis protein CheX